MVGETEWRERAACRGMDTAVFWPARGDAESYRTAIETCRRCPVRDQCLESHLGEETGIWGGLSEKARRRERALRRAQGIPVRTYPNPLHELELAPHGTQAAVTRHYRSGQKLCSACREWVRLRSRNRREAS